MRPFEIIIIILTAVGLGGGIIAVWIKTQIDLAKIQVTITFFQKDLDRKEFAICNLERENKADHKILVEKIDSLIEKVNEK